MSFAGLVASVLVLVVTNRTFSAVGGLRGIRRNAVLAAIMAFVIAFFLLVFEVPAIAGLFRLAMLDGRAMLAIGLLSIMTGGTLALLKWRLRISGEMGSRQPRQKAAS